MTKKTPRKNFLHSLSPSQLVAKVPGALNVFSKVFFHSSCYLMVTEIRFLFFQIFCITVKIKSFK